jgi:hypothetical protein
MSTSEGDVRVQRLDALLTPGEAAAYSRLTVGQLAQLRYRGLGPVYLNPTPRRVLYRRSDLDAWLYASERQSTASRR